MIMGVDLQGQSQQITQKSEGDSLKQEQTDAENKKQADALKGFQQVLQELP
jgi:hypothetical protein